MSERRALRVFLTACIAASVIPSGLLLAVALGAPASLIGTAPGELGIIPIVGAIAAVWQFVIRPRKQLKAPAK